MTEKEVFVEFWRMVIEQLGGSMSYGDLADLDHETQVEIFGWCGCEDSDPQYDDCPKGE